MIQALKLMIEVTVGLSPTMPIDERCRRWTYTSLDYEADREDAVIFRRLCDEAMAYAREQMHPAYNNYVRVDWTWV